MEQLVICILLAVLGLCLGSFAGATVWRLRARQLVEDKAEKESVDEREYKKLLPLTKATLTTDRSRCLHCGHELAWYDLIPLASWISTSGRCRYCHKKIGKFEPLIELGVAAFFVSLYLLWVGTLTTPLDTVQFALWLAAGVALAILFAYDLRWFLLPNQAMFPLIGIATLIAILHLFGAPDLGAELISLSVSIVILSGLYFVLWLYSKGQWIGFGDIKLGLALALLLIDWRLAFITLFSANLIGCLVVIPGMIAGKVTRKTHVPFGPLMIAGFVIATFFGDFILQWYFTIFP